MAICDGWVLAYGTCAGSGRWGGELDCAARLIATYTDCKILSFKNYVYDDNAVLSLPKKVCIICSLLLDVHVTYNVRNTASFLCHLLENEMWLFVVPPLPLTCNF